MNHLQSFGCRSGSIDFLVWDLDVYDEGANPAEASIHLDTPEACSFALTRVGYFGVPIMDDSKSTLALQTSMRSLDLSSQIQVHP